MRRRLALDSDVNMTTASSQLQLQLHQSPRDAFCSPLDPSELALDAPPCSDSLCQHHHAKHQHQHQHPHASDLDLDASGLKFKPQTSSPADRLLRASDLQHPFTPAKLQHVYDLGDAAMELTMNLFRARPDRELEFFHEQQVIEGLSGKPPHSLPSHARLPPLSWRNASKLQDERQWKLVKEVGRDQDKIRVFRHERRRQRTTTMMARGIIASSLSKVMDGLYAEKTKDARVLYGLLSDKFLDTAVLHVDSFPTEQQPFQFAGVTWMAMEGTGCYGVVCKDRDFLCFKRTGTFEDENGDEFGFLSLQSIDTSGQDNAVLKPYLGPAATANSNYVRGYVSLTIFFKAMSPDCVYMFAKGDFNARGHMAHRVSDSFFAELIGAFGNAGQSGQAKMLAVLMQSMNAGHLPPGGLVGTSSRAVSRLFGDNARCGVCSKTMWNVLQTPEFCRSCWTRTCRKCQVTLPIYCADFHRAHGVDDHDKLKSMSSIRIKPRHRMIAKPCCETFCVSCVCAVLPWDIQPPDNRSSAMVMGTPNPRAKKKTRTSMGYYDRRSSLHGRGSVCSGASKRSSSANRMSDQAPPVVVQLPSARYGRRAVASFMTVTDDSISVKSSSVESDKYHQRRMHVARPTRSAAPPADTNAAPNPKSMLEVLETMPCTATTARPRNVSGFVSASSQSSGRQVLRGCSGMISLISFESSSSPTSAASSRVSRKRQVHVVLKKPPTPKPMKAPKVMRPKPKTPTKRDDEYYHKMLRGYLTARRSSMAHTTDDTSSMTTCDNLDERDLLDKTAEVLAPPISNDRPFTPSMLSVSSMGSV